MHNQDDNAQVLARLAALKDMSVKQLKAEWEKLFSSEAPNNSRSFLEQRLAYRIQELTFGGLSKPVRQLLDALADEVEGKKVRKSVIADPRNPVIGTRLVREWNGAEHYFADFLSLLENRAKAPEIPLYTADEERHVVVEQGIFLEVEAEARRRSGLGDGATLEDVLRDDRANAELHRLGGFADNESVLVHHGRLRRSLAAQMRMPTSITLPENVWIFGAVNMDDTTHQLSPKVLDRVQVVRFRNPMLADWDAIEAEVQEASQNLPSHFGELRMTPEDFGVRSDYPAFNRHNANVAFLSHLSRDYLDPLGVEFGLRAIRQSQGYMIAAEAVGINPDEALDNVIKHKILPKIAFDTARPAGSGRSRRELLDEFRTELTRRFEGTSLDLEASCVADLGRMIRLADGNNGIVNYWLR